MYIESERRKIMKDKKETAVMSEARRKAKRDIAHLTKLGILKKVEKSSWLFKEFQVYFTYWK